jgi:GT2 family glycosyltransferase
LAELAISVVNWNVRDLLAGCLQSLRQAVRAASIDAEIWVVDNASHDGSVEMLARTFPDVHLIASPVNLGFGGGHNLALRAMGFSSTPVSPRVEVSEGTLTIQGVQYAVPQEPALPRYVLILNPDTLVRETALAEMVRFMDRAPRVGGCGPRLVYGDGRFQHAAYRFPSLTQTFLDFWPLNWRLTESRLNGRYTRRAYDRHVPFAIDHPLGAAMLFRREVIAQTGGFDLDYYMYVEEIDWCMRIKRAGWGICCVPGAEIVHYEGQSTRQIRPQMVVALWRSRYTLFRKHYSMPYRWVVRRIVRAGMRAQVRRARSQLDAPAAEGLIEAYRQVIAM